MDRMRTRPDEKCIVPYCDEPGGAKPIYIQLTVEGKRTWKKVGALCKPHLAKAMGVKPESQYEDPDNEPDVQAMRSARYTPDWLPSATEKARQIMRWLVSCPADDINFKTNLLNASLPLLRRVLERLEDELKRGMPHKTRIKKVTARIRALEKEILKKDAKADYESGGVVDQVLPRKKVV